MKFSGIKRSSGAKGRLAHTVLNYRPAGNAFSIWIDLRACKPNIFLDYIPVNYMVRLAHRGFIRYIFLNDLDVIEYETHAFAKKSEMSSIWLLKAFSLLSEV